MSKALAGLAAIAIVVLLAGCGGGGAQSASDMAAKLGCPHAKVSSKPHGMEPPRADRVACHGVTVVTFTDNSTRDTYVHVVKAANKAFRQPFAAATGDGWAIMGKPAAVEQAKSQLAG